MAINYLAKLCESASMTNPCVVPLTAGCAANSMVLVALAKRTSGSGGVTVVDSSGNTYTVVVGLSNNLGRAFVAYCRTPVALTTSHTLTVTWGSAGTDAWISAHAYDNVFGTAHYTVSTAGTGASPQAIVEVTGSDWLAFGTLYFPTQTSLTVTPVSSNLSRDDTTSSDAECFSRNGTSGTTHTVGGTIPSATQWSGAAASFLVDPSGSGSGNKRGQPTLIGV